MRYRNNSIYISEAILAALLYGLSNPFSKLLLIKISPYLLSSLLYLGAGLGMLLVDFIRRCKKAERSEAKLTKAEFPYVILMIVLDIAAPILMLFGLLSTHPATASLLNNFEIVATTLIAFLVFKEAIGRRIVLSITLITIASIILSISDFSSFNISFGSLLVVLAALCWGLENNCTRRLSLKDPLQIVIVKGLGSGFGALFLAFIVGEFNFNFLYILLALILGFFAYGLSIFFYVTSQRHLGASRTSAYYALAPFIGVGISYLLFQVPIEINFLIATIVMIIGTYLSVFENHNHKHFHSYLSHDHKHNHNDGHHFHTHDYVVKSEHSHEHIHEEMEHSHHHTPDIHHNHEHSK